MAKLLSRTFKSLKPHTHSDSFSPNPLSKSTPPSKLKLSLSSPGSSPEVFSASSSSSKSRSSTKNPWSVYLILSTNPPIKTYVGVTNHFSRRLKQHNGELRGGAKASRAGRPWVCACLITGFSDRNEGNLPAKEKLLSWTNKWRMDHFHYCYTDMQPFLESRAQLSAITWKLTGALIFLSLAI